MSGVKVCNPHRIEVKAIAHPAKANNSPIKHAKILMGTSRLPKAASSQYLMGFLGTPEKMAKPLIGICDDG
ncbi:MAG: hypothetical protein KME12_16435 [Trichocoleus desertorum ATA4-8-CV12]|nr:hypothetical protein [Trichocoleus desertorum ATA4-8-CV12]